MSFFSEDRAQELRELFFESAQELLQALNEEALELEKRPADAEIVRTIRRTIHTLKGDSATCGFREFSDLAHELEDVLSPDIAARAEAAIARVVLSAADVFDAMLAAYRRNLQPPDSSAFREMVRALVSAPPTNNAPVAAPCFSTGNQAPNNDGAWAPAWSEYEHLLISESAAGRAVFTVGITLDAHSPMRTAGVQLVRNALAECGHVLVIHPDHPGDSTETIEAAIASDHDQDWIARKCRVPGVVANLVVTPYFPPRAESPQVIVSPATAEPAHTAPAENTLRVDAERVDTVLNLVGELIIGKSMLHQAVNEFARRFPRDPLRANFTDLLARHSQVLNDLQRSVMKVRMVPVEQLFRRLPRVVRDVAKLSGKDVVLEVSGQDTDLDKSILDALAEPLTHLVRNAVDHGIEPPELRARAGKPAQGTVRLNAYHQGNQVVIEIGDDGRGIDRQQITAKAVAARLVHSEDAERLTDDEILDLIFQPGFSTAPEITTVSGRGVGLDVVKAVLARLKGSVSVHTRPAEGTTFQLKVPLTLAIIKALLFRAAGRLYAVPLGSVLEITRTGADEIHRVDDHEVLQLRHELLTVVRLSRLTSGEEPRPSPRAFVIVVDVCGRKFGLVVDRVVGEEELVIKALDGQLVSSELVSGASILGDGTVVLILNLTAVVQSFGRLAPAALAHPMEVRA